MKKKVISFVFIYIILFLYLFISSSIYALYIIKTNNNQNIIINLIITSIFYFLTAFLYSNHFHKKGLIIGILATVVHLLTIKLLLTICNIDVSFNFLLILINIVSGALGGFLGILFKKIL